MTQQAHGTGTGHSGHGGRGGHGLMMMAFMMRGMHGSAPVPIPPADRSQRTDATKEGNHHGAGPS